MNLTKFSLIIFLIILISCEQSIDPEKIETIKGLSVNTESEELLDGKYKCVTPIGNTYRGDHVSTFEFDKGIPVGKWSYTFNGDPIHSGKYLIEKKLKKQINSITNSRRTDLNLWEEGGHWMLNITLIFPKNIDSLSLNNVTNIANKSLIERYGYNSIDVFLENDSTIEKIFVELIEKNK